VLTHRLKHPRIKIVADLFHMALEEADLPKAIRDNAPDIGHVHLADSNRRLPGQGMTDFAAISAALKEINFGGWASFECGDPSENEPKAAQYLADFPASLEMLKKAGIV
jgi:sugar phosphate isomerase/epimerase